MQRLLALTIMSSLSAGVQADAGYAIGLGVSADNNDGRAVTALLDLSLNDEASVTASLGTTRTDAVPQDLSTRDWSLGGRYDFGPIGFELSGGQSGDPDDFDADDLSVGLFHRGEHFSWSARYLTRDLNLVLRTVLTRDALRFDVPLDAHGYRLGAGYRTDSRWFWQASYRRYDYDRDLSALGGRFLLQRLSPTTLSLATSLLDESSSLGVDIPLAREASLNLTWTRDELAGGLGSADSLSVGWLQPIGTQSDLELSIGVSQPDDQFDSGSAVFFNVLYLYYGLFSEP